MGEQLEQYGRFRLVKDRNSIKCLFGSEVGKDELIGTIVFHDGLGRHSSGPN